MTAVKSQAPDKAPAGGSSINQLLGIKGASQETVILFIFSDYFLNLGLRLIELRIKLFYLCIMMCNLA